MTYAMQIWKNKIVLRLPPDTKVDSYPSLRPYLKFSEKFKNYLIEFSAQNLRRIHHNLGSTSNISERYRIEELKARSAYMRAMVSMAERVFSGEFDHIEVDYKMPPLAPYQHRAVIFLSMVPCAPLFADCGLGKTYIVLNSIAHMMKAGQLQPGKTLICGKLATLETGWLEDAEKFTDLKVNLLWRGSAYKKKEKILAALEDPADVYLINHDGLRVYKDQLVEKNFDNVVIDESTILKSFRSTYHKAKGGAFGKALMEVAHAARRRVVMSGTPAPNGLEDLWGQFHFLDPDGILLEPSFSDFRNTYMEQVFFGALKKDENGRTMKGVPENPDTPSKWVASKGSYNTVGNIIRPLVFRARIRDHLKDLPECSTIRRSVTMTGEQKKHYKDMKKFLEVLINDEYISASNKLTEMMKLRQITGGFLIDHKEEAHAIPVNPKLDMMDSLLNDEIDRSKKVVVYAQYRWEIETLRDRYKDYGVVTVYGGNTSTNNVKAIKDFRDDENIRIIILHPKSVAHGVTFTMSHYLIFYSISHSAEDNYQSIARIKRAGQKSAMFVYYLLARDSIDELIYRAIQIKDTNQEKLIDQDKVDQRLLDSWR